MRTVTNRHRWVWAVGAAWFLAIGVFPVTGRGDDPNGAATPRAHTERETRANVPPSAGRLVDRVSEIGQHARGLYVNSPFIRAHGHQGALEVIRNAGMNAAVIDLKDGMGRVHHDTHVALLEAQESGILGDAAALVRLLKENGIYTIARIVCFSDRRLAASHPELAVRDRRPERRGQPLLAEGNRSFWLDPYNRTNQDMLIEIAREAEALGFDEVQLDYIRFPVDDSTRFARFPAQTDEPRHLVLLGFLRRMDEAIGIPIGVDVFGLNAWRVEDPTGLGQALGLWRQHVEVISPMLYLNNMSAWGGNNRRNRAEMLVEAGVRSAREGLGEQTVLRPFLQAFRVGSDHYDPEFIAEQIRGARTGGADGVLFWDPGSTYRLVGAAMTGRAHGLLPFPIDDRMQARARAWSAAASAGTAPSPGASPTPAPSPAPPQPRRRTRQ
jgi:hypothetical protein